MISWDPDIKLRPREWLIAMVWVVGILVWIGVAG